MRTVSLVYHLSILRYFQFNELGWRFLRIKVRTEQVPCKNYRDFSDLHCELHTQMPANAKGALNFEIGIVPWLKYACFKGIFWEELIQICY